MLWCAVRKNKARCLLHLQSVFKKNPYYGEDTAKRLFDKGLCLPSFSAFLSFLGDIFLLGSRYSGFFLFNIGVLI